MSGSGVARAADWEITLRPSEGSHALGMSDVRRPGVRYGETPVHPCGLLAALILTI